MRPIAILTAFTSLLSTFIVLGLDSASGRWYYDSDDPARRWIEVDGGALPCGIAIII